MTLCGAPDWQIMLWDWDKCRLMSQIALGLTIPQSVPKCSFQVTFNPNDLSSESILLTGPCNTFKYIKKDGDHNLTTSHTQINNMDPGKKISPNFTCHSWSQETGHILVCTDNGEMIICENSGDYKAYIMDANPGRSIEAVISLSQGFLIAQGSSLYIYRTSRVDDRAPLKLKGEKCNLMIHGSEARDPKDGFIIESMAINSSEN